MCLHSDNQRNTQDLQPARFLFVEPVNVKETKYKMTWNFSASHMVGWKLFGSLGLFLQRRVYGGSSRAGSWSMEPL